MNDPPKGSLKISGEAKQGEELKADTSEISDADGLGPFSYQWNRDGTDIDGATKSTYTLTQADIGKTIKVTVSYTDGGNKIETLTSEPTSVVSPSGIVTITGTLRQGEELKADTSGISGVFDVEPSIRANVAKAAARARASADNARVAFETADAARVAFETAAAAASAARVDSDSALLNFTATMSFLELVTEAERAADEAERAADEAERAADEAERDADAGAESLRDKADSFRANADRLRANADRLRAKFTADLAAANAAWVDAERAAVAAESAAHDAEYTASDAVRDAEYTASDAVRDASDTASAAESAASDAASAANDVAYKIWSDAASAASAAAYNDVESAIAAYEIFSRPIYAYDGFSYQWKRIDSEVEDAIIGATNKTYTLVQDDVGKKISVTVSYIDEEGATKTQTSAPTTSVAGPFKPTTKIELQTAIDEWYILANNGSGTANNDKGNPKHWDTSLITDLSFLFYGKTQTNHPDISKWDVSKVTSMQGTFSNSTFNGELNNWNVSSVIDFSFTFANNVVFNKPLFRWNVQDAITMKSMFDNAYSFNQNIEPPMMQNKDANQTFPTPLTWDETTINGYLTTIYGSATNTDTPETPQTNPTEFKGVFGMIALLKKTYLNALDGSTYNTIKVSFSEVISELITNQQEILKYNYTYDEDEETWKKTSPSIYFANTKDKSDDELNDAKDKLNRLRLNTIVDGMLLINKAYDIAKGLGADYSDLISEMKRIYDNIYTNLPFYVAWYAPLLTTKANFLNNALTFHNGATGGTINKSLKDFIGTNPIKTINGKNYSSTDKQKIVESSSSDLYENFKTAYTLYTE